MQYILMLYVATASSWARVRPPHPDRLLKTPPLGFETAPVAPGPPQPENGIGDELTLPVRPGKAAALCGRLERPSQGVQTQIIAVLLAN